MGANSFCNDQEGYLEMKRVAVGVTGASGAVYGIRLLEILKGKVETHLVVSRNAKVVIEKETQMTSGDVRDLASCAYDLFDFNSPLASGSFRTDGMVIAPCSIKTLSSVAHSYADSLLARAADVTLKERRPLILVVRESPLHCGHIRLMAKVTEMGAVVCPPMPAFYTRPKTIDDIIDGTVARVLDLIGIENELASRWGE